MKKNGILTFLFAFVPGAGQMYQGYMKRGLSLITLFFLCMMAGMLLLEPLALTALIVWMYSFFDTFNLRAQFIAGTAPADDYLVHFNTKDARLTLFFRDSHKLVGWALIALGAMVAYQNIIMRVLGDVMWRWGQNNAFFRAVYLMLEQLPEVVVCVALIVCGVWPHIVSEGHLVASTVMAQGGASGGGNPFPRAGTFAASEEFYHFGAYTIYQGFASDIEAGSKAAQGAKVYLRCSTSTRCSTNAKGGAAE